jgi:anti-sigma regulatory factor (Ser/Thr protein kinase)
MVAMILCRLDDVRKIRECVRDLALAAGVPDAGAAVLAAGELGNNCVEHGDHTPALLMIGCEAGRLSLRFENRCEHQPTWQTCKPVAVQEFRTGGYGLQLVRTLATCVDCQWRDGRAVVQAEFKQDQSSSPSSAAHTRGA